MKCFDFYCRIHRYSISITPEFIQVDKWDGFYFDSKPIFRHDFKPRPKPKITPPPTLPEMENDDDDFNPIPF